MQLNLNSIIIFVNDLSLLEEFYVDTLKLRVLEKTEDQWLLLVAGNMTIGLHKIGQDSAGKEDLNIQFHSNTKIVFEVEGDLATIRKELMTKNVALKEIVTWDNYDYWLCDGRDPEGNIFQLKQHK